MRKPVPPDEHYLLAGEALSQGRGLTALIHAILATVSPPTYARARDEYEKARRAESEEGK